MKRAALAPALALGACMQSHVETTAVAPVAAPLPRPAHIVLTEFAVSPDQVHLDAGIGASLRRAASGTAPEQAAQEEAAEAQQAITETLAERLAADGLPVERLPASAAPPPGSLLVQGQIVAIDEGNRTRRTLIGLGAGQSRVVAEAQLYDATDPAHPRFLQSFEATGDSGRMPGAAETMGAGAAAERVAASAATSAILHGYAERYKTGGAQNAAKAGGALAREIDAFAARQGWVAASN